MAKKRRGRKMSPIRKWVKAIASGIASVVVITGVSHGAIAVGIAAARGQVPPERLPEALIWQYTGFSTLNKTVNWSQTLASVGAIIGSIIAAKLIRYGSRSV